MNLREYEWFRNPRGLHNNGPYHPFRPEHYLRPHMGWARLVAGGDEYTHHASKLAAGGCMPIVRIHRSYMGAMPVPEAWYAVYQEYYDAGCRWFELYDQPNAPGAWPKDPDGGPRVDLTWENHEAVIEPLVDNWIDWAERILEMGGYPAFPSMAPRDDRAGAAPNWIDAMLRYLKAVHNDRFLDVLDNGLWCATVADVGNRFYQEPPGGPDHVARPFYQESANESGWHFEYPYDPILQRHDPKRTVFGGTSNAPHADTHGLTAGGETFQELLLYHFTAGPVPVVATSGGISPVPAPGDDPVQPDELYPPYDSVAHAEATLAMWNWVATVGPPWFFGVTLSTERVYYPHDASPAIERMIDALPIEMEVADIECGVAQSTGDSPTAGEVVEGEVEIVEGAPAGDVDATVETPDTAFEVGDTDWIDATQEEMDEAARRLAEDDQEAAEVWPDYDEEMLWVEPEAEEPAGDVQAKAAAAAEPEAAEGVPEWLEPYAAAEDEAPAAAAPEEAASADATPEEIPEPEEPEEPEETTEEPWQLPLMPDETGEADDWPETVGDPYFASEDDIELETGTELSEEFDEEPILEDADESGEWVEATENQEYVPSGPAFPEELPDDMQEELAAITGAEEPEELAEEVEEIESDAFDDLDVEPDVEELYEDDIETIEEEYEDLADDELTTPLDELTTPLESPTPSEPAAPDASAPANEARGEGVPEWLGQYAEEPPTAAPDAAQAGDEPAEDVPEWLEEFLFADVDAEDEQEAGEGLPGWLWDEFERSGARAEEIEAASEPAAAEPVQQPEVTVPDEADEGEPAVMGQTLEESAELPGGDPGEPPDVEEGKGPVESVVVIPGPAAPEVDEHWLIISPDADPAAFFDRGWRYWQSFRPTVAFGWNAVSLIPTTGEVAITVLCPVETFDTVRGELSVVRPQATLDLIGSDVLEEVQAELNWRAMTDSRLG